MRTDRPRVLIVEDEQALAHAYAWTFREWGWEASKAFGGEQAVGMLVEPWQLITLDLMMAGMNGVDVLREIRKRGLKTPVVVMTGMTPDGTTKAVSDLGPDKIFFKPHIFEPLRDYTKLLLDDFYSAK